MKIREQFDMLDKDGNGALDRAELRELLIAINVPAEQARREAELIIRSADVDNSGEIEFDEFAQIWQRKILSVNERYVKDIFTVFDENGDGSIDAAELAKVIEG